jgi:hypothetical protein
MNIEPKYYFRKSTQILIPNQLVVDNIFALKLRNLLIIIIFALYSTGVNHSENSFFFSVKKSLSASNSK